MPRDEPRCATRRPLRIGSRLASTHFPTHFCSGPARPPVKISNSATFTEKCINSVYCVIYLLFKFFQTFQHTEFTYYIRQRGLGERQEHRRRPPCRMPQNGPFRLVSRAWRSSAAPSPKTPGSQPWTRLRSHTGGPGTRQQPGPLKS